MRTNPKFDVVNENGEVVDSFRTKHNATEKANKLNREMFGKKFKIRRIEDILHENN